MRRMICVCKLLPFDSVYPLALDPQIDLRKQQRMMERANEFNAKYQKTIESSTGADNFANKKVSTCDGKT